MSERPERAWAAAKAMYEKKTGKNWDDLTPGTEELNEWLSLAYIGLDAAEDYSRQLSGVKKG